MAFEADNVAGVRDAALRLGRYLPRTDWWALGYAAELSKRSLEVGGLATSLALEMLKDRLPEDVSDAIRQTADLVIDAQRPFVAHTQAIASGRDPIALPALRDDLLNLLTTVVVAWQALWQIWDERPFLTHAQLKNPRIWGVADEMRAAGQRLEAIAPQRPYGPPDASPSVVTAPPTPRRRAGLLWASAALGVAGLFGLALWRGGR